MLPRKVDEILSSVDQLRPMPVNLTKILRAIEDPDSNIPAIAKMIGQDQALAALVLRMSNSATLGYMRTCTSLSEATLRLGLKRMKSVLLGVSATGPLTRRLSGYRLGAGELWNHAIATAMAAEWFAWYFHYPDAEEVYLAGLLHDMGKLLLDQYVLSDYTQMVDLMQRYSLTLWQVEERLLGIDHAAVGGLMAEKWTFPVILVDAIRYHHAPSLARSRPELPAIINIANACVIQPGEGLSDLFNKNIHPETLNILKLRDVDISELHQRVSGYLANGY
jgi:putative nucleotidyltransferase with HDIG domain